MNLDSLTRKKERLEAALHKEALRLHSVIENMGWGAGMRRTKCTPSFAREDALRARLQAVEQQIKALTHA